MNWLLQHALAVALAAVAAAVALTSWRSWSRRRRVAPVAAVELAIDVAALAAVAPPEGPTVLEFYNQPVRLVAIVLAPAGRARELPPDDHLPYVLDAILPGLDQVAALHKSLLRRWPSQVSPRGFARAFFKEVRLPGQGGKGTPWSSVAGVFKIKDQPMMAGLLLCAKSPNSLGQAIIETEHDWLGCLRVRQH